MRVLTDPLLRYRVLANVVGAVLLVLVGVALPLHYVFGHPQLSMTVSPIHGLLYICLVLSVVALGRGRGWPVQRIVLVALGGTVPVVSFLVERRVARREAGREPVAAVG